MFHATFIVTICSISTGIIWSNVFLESKYKNGIRGLSNGWMYIIIKCNVRENHQHLICVCTSGNVKESELDLKREQYCLKKKLNSCMWNDSLPFRRGLKLGMDQSKFSFMKLSSLLLNLFRKISDLFKWVKIIFHKPRNTANFKMVEKQEKNMASSLGIRNNVNTMVKISEPDFPAISLFFF